MVGSGQLRGKEEEDQVHGLAVDGFEVDRSFEARKEAEDPGDPGELAVRDGDAVADPGGAEPFALEEDIEELALADPREAGGLLGDPLKSLLLRVHFQSGNDRIQ